MNSRSLLCCIVFATASGFIPRVAAQVALQPPRPDRKLRASLEALVAGFKGQAGIYVRHLASGREAAIHADELFPTASMIKVSILMRLLQRVEAGELRYGEKRTYSERWSRGGEDLLALAKDGSRISLSKLMHLMASTSDNTASVWGQAIAGGGAEINRWLTAQGFSTRVNSRTKGREKEFKRYGWGRTTPRDMAEQLIRIRLGKCISPAASERLYRILSRSYWDGEALSQIPPWVQAASKQGAVSRARSEVVLVNAASGAYVFCVATREQQDRSWSAHNEGFILIRRVSRLLYRTFEPGDRWVPPDGAARYR